MNRFFISFALFMSLAGSASSEARTTVAPVTSVRVSAGSFSPTLGKKVSLTFRADFAGLLGIQVLDRDGYPVRTLAAGKPLKRGPVAVEWDGRDDAGRVVPDEAYSFRIELIGSGRSAVYFPAAEAPRMHSGKVAYFDRKSGVLVYTLPEACRVHLQSGTAALDPATGKRVGPVLKTVVNREPRASGHIVESWGGLDESGTVYVPDLPDFVASVMATSLPENSVITTGNRETPYLEWATRRMGKSLLPPFEGVPHHHMGLPALEDVSPSLVIEPQEATLDGDGKTWKLASNRFRAKVRVRGLSAEGFSRHPGAIFVFLDGKLLEKRPLAASQPELDVTLPGDANGSHILSVNWATEYGPSATNSVRLNLTGGRR